MAPNLDTGRAVLEFYSGTSLDAIRHYHVCPLERLSRFRVAFLGGYLCVKMERFCEPLEM